MPKEISPLQGLPEVMANDAPGVVIPEQTMDQRAPVQRWEIEGSAGLEERVESLVDDELSILDDLPPTPIDPVQREVADRRRGGWVKAMIIGTVMAAILAGVPVKSEAGQFGLGRLKAKLSDTVKEIKEEVKKNRVSENKTSENESESVTEALPGALTEADVEAAIAKGLTEKPDDIGAHITPYSVNARQVLMGAGIGALAGGLSGDISAVVGKGAAAAGGAALGAGVGAAANEWSGVKTRVYTPRKFVELQAAQARAEYRKITPQDITTEMRSGVLRVFVDTAGPNSVEKVVILSTEKDTEGIQPINSSASGEFQFSLDQIEEARGKNNGKFYIVLLGERHNGNGGTTKVEKKMEVKDKYLKQLF